MGRDEIYILKHKDLDVAMVKINPFSGRIEYVLEVYMPEELPVGILTAIMGGPFFIILLKRRNKESI